MPAQAQPALNETTRISANGSGNGAWRWPLKIAHRLDIDAGQLVGGSPLPADDQAPW